MAYISGTTGRDFIHRAGDGRTAPAGTTDIATATTGEDTIVAGTGNDTVFGDAGNDTAIFTAATDGTDTTDLGEGADTVNVLDRDAQIALPSHLPKSATAARTMAARWPTRTAASLCASRRRTTQVA